MMANGPTQTEGEEPRPIEEPIKKQKPVNRAAARSVWLLSIIGVAVGAAFLFGIVYISSLYTTIGAAILFFSAAILCITNKLLEPQP